MTALLGRCAAREQPALAELYDLTIGTVWPLVLQRTGRVDQAEEVMASVYLRLWRDSPSLVDATGCGWAAILCVTREAVADFVGPQAVAS
jgi:DNA-directed RNA polymerase specialized sigma24 family protein